MTSPFGMRASRRSGRPTFHAGVDFRASTGDPVYAVTDGTVRVVRSDEDRRERAPTNGYGNVIGLEHTDGTWSVYAHLSRVAVTEGQAVRAGEQLGEAGNTSNGKFPGMGTHLHFEIRTPNGGATPFPGPYRRYNVDPQAWLLERGINIDGGIVVDTARAGGMAGLGATPAVPAALAEDDNGLPDEPVRSADTFDPPSIPLIVGLAGTGIAVVAGVLGIAVQAR